MILRRDHHLTRRRVPSFRREDPQSRNDVPKIQGAREAHWRARQGEQGAVASLKETGILNDPQHWLNRAEEARVQAEQMTSAETKRQMLEIAAGYLKMAENAEARGRQDADRASAEARRFRS